MTPSPQEFIDEEAIAARLGVDRDWLRTQRGQRGVDFKRGNGGRIEWSADAVERLAVQAAVPTPKIEKSAAVVLVVAKVDLPAQYQLACVEPGVPLHTRHAWKLVRISGLMRGRFIPGMRLRAEQNPDLGWRYLGNPEDPAAVIKYPKRRGLW